MKKFLAKQLFRGFTTTLLFYSLYFVVMDGLFDDDFKLKLLPVQQKMSRFTLMAAEDPN